MDKIKFVGKRNILHNIKIWFATNNPQLGFSRRVPTLASNDYNNALEALRRWGLFVPSPLWSPLFPLQLSLGQASSSTTTTTATLSTPLTQSTASSATTNYNCYISSTHLCPESRTPHMGNVLEPLIMTTKGLNERVSGWIPSSASPHSHSTLLQLQLQLVIVGLWPQNMLSHETIVTG